MLSMSLAFRQQSRCIQSAILKPGSFPNNASTQVARLPFLLQPKNNNEIQKSQFNSTLVPARYFSATPVRASGDHVKLWTAERLVAVSLIPAFVVPFIHTTPMTDALFCTLLVIHSHWGVEAIVVDYIRPALFKGSTVIPNIAQALVWGLSAFTLGGLYYFNYSDVGIINAIKMLWSI